MSPLLPFQEFSRLFSYEPETGKLYWLPRTKEMFSSESALNAWAARHSGKEAFTHSHQGYLYARVLGKMYVAHRVAWLLTYKVWPDELIDHIDGDRSNNKISNLRCVSKQGNALNRGIGRNNSSGCCGVYWSSRKRRWFADISYQRRKTRLGSFVSYEDAVKARKAAEEDLGFHPTERRGGAL